MAELATARARSTLNRALRAVERRCGLSLVLAVRRRSGSYLAAELLAGVLAAAITLVALLFAPLPFSRLAILIDPIAVGIIAAAVGSRIFAVQRALTPRHVRERFVREAARASFFALGVGHTATATGVLIYVALLERRIEVIADRGVRRAVGPDAWAEAVAGLQRAIAARADAAALAEAIVAFGERVSRESELRC